MKRRILYVENFAKVENVIIRDLSNEYGLDERAARIMQQVENLIINKKDKKGNKDVYSRSASEAGDKSERICARCG